MATIIETNLPLDCAWWIIAGKPLHISDDYAIALLKRGTNARPATWLEIKAITIAHQEYIDDAQLGSIQRN